MEVIDSARSSLLENAKQHASRSACCPNFVLKNLGPLWLPDDPDQGDTGDGSSDQAAYGGEYRCTCNGSDRGIIKEQIQG